MRATDQVHQVRSKISQHGRIYCREPRSFSTRIYFNISYLRGSADSKMSFISVMYRVHHRSHVQSTVTDYTRHEEKSCPRANLDQNTRRSVRSLNLSSLQNILQWGGAKSMQGEGGLSSDLKHKYIHFNTKACFHPLSPNLTQYSPWSGGHGSTGLRRRPVEAWPLDQAIQAARDEPNCSGAGPLLSTSERRFGIRSTNPIEINASPVCQIKNTHWASRQRDIKKYKG